MPASDAVPADAAMASHRGELAAIFLVLFSCVAIGIAPTFAKLAIDGGSDSLSIVTARNLIMAVLLAVLLRCLKRPFTLPAQAFSRSLAMGPVYILLGIGYLGAVAYIPVNLAILIYFLHPLLIGIAVRLLGHEAVSWQRIAVLGLGLVGLGIAIGVRWQHLNMAGIGLALLSAMACTVLIAGNSIIMKNADSLTVTFWMVLSASVISLIVQAFYGAVHFPHDAAGWVGFIGVGLAYTVGLSAFFVAVPVIGAARATILTNIEPLLGIGFALGLLGEHVSLIQAGGMCLVLLSIGITEMVRK